MRKYALLAAATGMALAGVAKADFHYSYSVADAGGGLERVSFYAEVTGTGVNVGDRALGSDLTIADINGHNLVTKFLTAAANSKADVTGTAAADPYNSDRSFVNLLGDPSGGTAGTDNDPTAYSIVQVVPANVHATYANGVPQFEVVGANLSGGVDATTANGGKGALMAVAVAPMGDGIHVSGSIGGILAGSPAQSVDITYPGIPEPTSLSLLGLGLGALVTRRRRA